ETNTRRQTSGVTSCSSMRSATGFGRGGACDLVMRVPIAHGSGRHRGVRPIAIQLLPDDTNQVLDDEHEVIRVARTWLEIEVLVEALGIIVLGVNQNGARANRVGSACGT